MSYREFRDGAGVQWKAWDTLPRDPANVRIGYVGGWLSFESEAERRRLHPIPDGWAAAPDSELLRWLGAAELMQTFHGELRHPQRAVRAAVEAPAPPSAGEEAKPGGAPEPAPTSLPDATASAVEKAREVIRAISKTIRGS